jgi:hypothetical protein
VRAEAVDGDTDAGLSQEVFGRVNSDLQVAEQLEQRRAGLAFLHGFGDRLAAELDLFGLHGHDAGGDSRRGVWSRAMFMETGGRA